jgi:hypothetical protein
MEPRRHRGGLYRVNPTHRDELAEKLARWPDPRISRGEPERLPARPLEL